MEFGNSLSPPAAVMKINESDEALERTDDEVGTKVKTF